MQEHSVYTKFPRLVNNHPHSKIVQQVLVDTMKMIAGAGPQDQTYLFANTDIVKKAELRQSSVQLGNADEKRRLRMVIPIRINSTVIAHDPPVDVFRVDRQPYSLEQALQRLGDFYLRHREEHYLQSEARVLMPFKKVIEPVMRAMHVLDKHCLFNVRAIQQRTLDGLTDEDKKNSLLMNDLAMVRIVLRDEYDMTDGTFDFKTDIHLTSPSIALAIAADRPVGTAATFRSKP